MAADNSNQTSDGLSFTAFSTGLFERMRRINRSWIERLREIHEIEQDFGSRLLAAKSPTEATTICHEWMAKRLEAVASEQQIFTSEWLGLVSDAESVRRAPHVRTLAT